MLAVAVIALAILVAIGWIRIADSNAVYHRFQAERNALAIRLARQANEFSHQLAQERASTILTSCDQQNARHDATIHELDLLTYEAKLKTRNPIQRRQIMEGQASSTLLVNALVPRQNCQLVLKKATGG